MLDAQWGLGYCARVLVRNQHPSATTGTWAVALDLGASTTFTTWNAVFSAGTGLALVGPEAHNAAIPPSQVRELGVCASIPSPGIQPRLVLVTSDRRPSRAW